MYFEGRSLGAGRNGGANDWSGEDIIDVVETDTAIGAFSSYTSLFVSTPKSSGRHSKSLGSLVGRKEDGGFRRCHEEKLFLC